ncbi:hypothetical protein ACOME3_006498 [Neoechinorhynchus agilis]
MLSGLVFMSSLLTLSQSRCLSSWERRLEDAERFQMYNVIQNMKTRTLHDMKVMVDTQLALRALSMQGRHRCRPNDRYQITVMDKIRLKIPMKGQIKDLTKKTNPTTETPVTEAKPETTVPVPTTVQTTDQITMNTETESEGTGISTSDQKFETTEEVITKVEEPNEVTPIPLYEEDTTNAFRFQDNEFYDSETDGKHSAGRRAIDDEVEDLIKHRGSSVPQFYPKPRNPDFLRIAEERLRGLGLSDD